MQTAIQTTLTRRDWLTACAAAAAASSVWAAEKTAGGRRVGAVAYSFWYSLGLFAYQKRSGDRMDVFGFVEATRKAGGSAAQIYWSMLQNLDANGFERLRRRAAELDVKLEIHGGTAFAPTFDRVLEMAAALGATVVGCSFGFLMRPGTIATLPAWDAHLAKCRERLRDLVAKAKARGIVLGVENHLDFTLEEMVDLMRGADSPHAGVIFDVGNWIGTLDDPLEAADALGQYVVGTHYKDFAIEEVARGFRFTMVPLGAGSLRLAEITARLARQVRPEAAYCIEMMNGQQFEVPWLEDRFWPPYRNKSARQVAATLRHIRGKAIDIAEFRPSSELDTLPASEHIALEHRRIGQCIATLGSLLKQGGAA